MNTQRVIVLGIALVAAGAAAFMVRSLIGGGTPPVQASVPVAPPVAMSEVLVASANLQSGQKLTPDLVHWEKWPKSAVDASLITHDAVGSPEEAVKGTVVRTPILANQPITNTAIVHTDQAGFMAALLTPGMRAVSIVISAESGAGGFILPNDRVDVILTRKLDGGRSSFSTAKVILSSVRVLAVDQTFSQAKDTKTVIGKTATVEVTPEQAGMIYSAQGAGQLSLALRPLGDNQAVDTKAEDAARKKKKDLADAGPVNVIRYGMAMPANPAAQEKAQ